MATRCRFLLNHALTSFRALLVHDAVAALPALNGILGLDEVVRSTVFHNVRDDGKVETSCVAQTRERHGERFVRVVNKKPLGRVRRNSLCVYSREMLVPWPASIRSSLGGGETRSF